MGGLMYSLQCRTFSVLFVLSVVGSCRSAPAPRATSGLVDDAGDTLAFETPARRVVSLIPAATELLFAIGADSVVALS